jgi:hypothetical protein
MEPSLFLMSSNADPGHRNVSCTWEGDRLMLRAKNGYDANELALAEEFSDAISVSIAQPFNGETKIESVTPLSVAAHDMRSS